MTFVVAWYYVKEIHKKFLIILMDRFICSHRMKVADQNQSSRNIHTLCSVEHGIHHVELIYVSNFKSKLFLKMVIIFLIFFSSNIDLVDGKKMLIPGEHAHARFTTFRPMIISTGQRFTIREGKTTVLTGIITNEHENVELPQNKLSEVVINE